MRYTPGNWKYRLLDDESFATGIEIPIEATTQFITMQTNGELLVRKGYAWDGPSGPTIDTKSFMRGSLFHDVGYQLMREAKVPIDRLKLFDQLLVDICELDGMWSWRRRWVYRGVRIGGGPHANPKPIKVLRAP